MELTDYSRFFFALAFVIGLIWLMAFVAKRLGLDKKIRGVSGAEGKLQLQEVLYLDPKRKLTLVRAGTTEYLLLLAGENAQLIDKREGRHDAAV